MDYNYIFRREHPFYRRNRQLWQRSRDAYSGGSGYINQALIRHVSEIDIEFAERRYRACYFNYPRKIARLITQYALSVPPERRNADAELEEDFSRTGLRVNEVMGQFSTLLNIYGSAFLLVDMPCFAGAVDGERKRREKLRPYTVALSPLSVPDYAYGDDGRLLWVLLDEDLWLNSDPYHRPERRHRRRLLTRNEWKVFEQSRESGYVELTGSGRHNLGVVPVVRAQEPDGFGVASNHWFEDVVRISDAILNNASEGQMNIIKQLFGLLVISENFARQGRNLPEERRGGMAEKFSHVLARSAAIWESSDERGTSRYISPGGVETEQIREENRMLKKEMFDVVGLALQRDNPIAQTAESKAWDFQNVRQFLTSRVELLEQFELSCWRIMNLWDRSVRIPEVVYNRDFAVTDLKSSVEALLDLRELSTDAEYHKVLARTGISLLEKYRKLLPEERKTLDKLFGGDHL